MLAITTLMILALWVWFPYNEITFFNLHLVHVLEALQSLEGTRGSSGEGAHRGAPNQDSCWATSATDCQFGALQVRGFCVGATFPFSYFRIPLWAKILSWPWSGTESENQAASKA